MDEYMRVRATWSRLTIVRVLLAVLVGCRAAYTVAQNPSTATVLSGDDVLIKGVVIDPAGAVVAKARVLIIDPSGKVTAEAFTAEDGTFEVRSRVKTATLAVYASGLGQFKKELNLAEKPTDNLEVKLAVKCSDDVEQVIPKKLDLHRFLVEIHHTGAFGTCPEKIYRLWGTGEASITYLGCGGKTFRYSRFIEPTALASTLAGLSKTHSGPVCTYYGGGIDAPRVELTVFSGSDPRLAISHDEGDEIQNVTSLERRLEKVIDPEDRMHSFLAGGKTQRESITGDKSP